MKKSVLTATAILAGVWYFPQFATGSDTACGALGQKAIAATKPSRPETSFQVMVMTGEAMMAELAVKTMAQNAHPNVPPSLTCTYIWYTADTSTPPVMRSR